MTRVKKKARNLVFEHKADGVCEREGERDRGIDGGRASCSTLAGSTSNGTRPIVRELARNPVFEHRARHAGGALSILALPHSG